ncbi:MAG: riboflavin synthase [Legionella sp.]|nr:MAG: riboflavin synthase [Legionella sp.]PJD99352.1 MAG: riboflavin synthase [Legionella sp.]
MFTGLIEKTGQVIANEKKGSAHRLTLSSSLESWEAGESIAVNGVCLTLLPMTSAFLQFDLSSETIERTTLGDLSPGVSVNMERSLLASSRFGGHYVSGHVDTTAQVQFLKEADDFLQVELSGFTVETKPYLIPKGSITVDGVSLTINEVKEQSIQLMLVPHTLLHTTLKQLKAGQQVNIEFDYFTRIVAHQLQLMGKLDYEVKS